MPMTQTGIPDDRARGTNRFHAGAAGWAGDVEMRYWEASAGDTSEYAIAQPHSGRRFGQLLEFEHHIVSIPLRDVADHVIECDGQVVHDGPYRAGTVTIMPAGCRWGMRWQGESQFVNLRIPRGQIRASGLPGPVHVAPVVAVQDPLLSGIGQEIQRGLKDSGLIDCSFLYALANTALAQVVRRYAHLSPVQNAFLNAPTRPLGRRRAADVAAYIEAHLGDGLPLTRLAALADLSPYHFARAFKDSFGMPPHAYVTERRIARARALLVGAPDLSLTDIAMQLGFATPSHFTTVFRRVTGTTPSALRQSRARGPITSP